MPKPLKEIAGKKRISDKEKRFAQYLYLSGERVETISKRLGISKESIWMYARDGNWIDGKSPAVSVDDFYNICLEQAMDCMLSAHFSDDDFFKAEKISIAHKISVMMRSIADIAPLRKATMQGFMRDVIKRYAKHPNLDEILRISQEYHDALYQEEEAEKV